MYLIFWTLKIINKNNIIARYIFIFCDKSLKDSIENLSVTTKTTTKEVDGVLNSLKSQRDSIQDMAKITKHLSMVTDEMNRMLTHFVLENKEILSSNPNQGAMNLIADANNAEQTAELDSTQSLTLPEKVWL